MMMVETAMSLNAELEMLGPKPVPGATMVIRVPGVMRGKQRPRFNRRTGHAHTPDQTVTMEAHVRHCADQAVGNPCLQGPLAVTIEVGVPIPVSWSKRRQTEAASGVARPIGKPDLDNIVKLVCDALNGVVWRDDAQIVAQLATKHYALVPETIIRVRAA
ncbi:RusA family crossover junction endodeoxyribonuclease [Pseudoroseomonas ludipueritiae]|uniref:RusA family crossover junction endodeoxyribonuclease n=1 Tax=Pseudoroseomonas ludipueritiae TaxID=198093 RepID=A0ABR7R581_9PROT|nr:RusA family crossover junction endodeoxyribonuclease [Pseudoroseomonas ludipueritiae]MBC9176790.1 RusA family crossover junction endodeoxyribonuclease [Pseudoroseomonas ludipueritiae]